MKRKFHVGFGEEGVCFLSDVSQTRRHTLTQPGLSHSAQADPVCANHLSCQGLAYSTTRSRKLALAPLWPRPVSMLGISGS